VPATHGSPAPSCLRRGGFGRSPNVAGDGRSWGRSAACRRPPEADRRSRDERATAHRDQPVTPLVSASRTVAASGFCGRFLSATLDVV